MQWDLSLFGRQHSLIGGRHRWRRRHKPYAGIRVLMALPSVTLSSPATEALHPFSNIAYSPFSLIKTSRTIGSKSSQKSKTATQSESILGNMFGLSITVSPVSLPQSPLLEMVILFVFLLTRAPRMVRRPYLSAVTAPVWITFSSQVLFHLYV